MRFRRQLAAAIATAALLSASAPKRSHTGKVTDNMCGGTHRDMAMGPDADCIRQCVRQHGAKYSLLAGKELFTLSDQASAARFAARKVVVKGLVDRTTMILQVETIAAAN